MHRMNVPYWLNQRGVAGTALRAYHCYSHLRRMGLTIIFFRLFKSAATFLNQVMLFDSVDDEIEMHVSLRVQGIFTVR